MSSVVVAGDTSGSVTIQAPAVAGSTTLTLPSSSGSGLLLNTTMTLLGTITPTLINSVSLGGLTLTSYKSLYIVMNVTPTSNAGSRQMFISSNNQQTGGGIGFNTGSTATLVGIILLDLTSGVLGGGVAASTVSLAASTPVVGGLSNVTTSSTTIYFRHSGTDTFNAGGSITIYGVY